MGAQLSIGLVGAAVLAALSAPSAQAQTLAFDIEPQRLPGALREFGLQSGAPIAYRKETAQAESSPGVRGELPAERALQAVLQGTHHAYARSGDGFVVMPASNLRLAQADTQPSTRAAQQSTDSGPTPEPQPAAVGDAPLIEITVTSSRIQRSGYTAPTPTTVIGADMIKARAATNVASVLYELPVFRPSAPGSQASADPGAQYVNLRGLGNDRTLVLMDGRRLVPSAAVDLNQIPALLIERTEVVTGGASAQWGSDAVAGVLNLITKRNFTGFEAQVQGGISDYDDYEELNAGFITGMPFAGDRGHLMFSAEYTKNNGTDSWYSRPWGAEEWILFNNPSPGTNDMPARWITSHNHLATMTPGGIITSGPLRGIHFGPGGTPLPFNYGDYPSAINMIGGDNHGNTFAATLRPASPVRRESFFGRADYQVSDAVNAFVEGLYAATDVQSSSVPGWNAGPLAQTPVATTRNPLVIRRDNPFLPDSIGAAMDAHGLDYINMGRISLDLGAQRPHVRNYTTRFAAGLEGEIGARWSWDAFYQYGENRYRQRIYNNRIDANWIRAVDAVTVPLTGGPAGLAPGSIVCRSTLTDPTDGCVPVNIFGHGSPSREAHDYVYGTAWAWTDYVQHSAAFNVRGDLFDTWAGPVSAAFGLEYREEEQETESDPISAANGFNLGNTKPIYGKFDVKEAYLESVVPLAADSSWADALDMQLAVRFADYSSIGSATTWKIGATWDLNSTVRLRASQSRDIRAPNIVELYSAPFFQTNTIVDPTLPAPNSYLVNQETVGNPQLQEETGDTFTAGVVLSPSFLDGFQTSLDYWQISIEDAVGALNPNTIIQRCVDGLTEYCPFITRDATGRISSVMLTQINLSSLDVSGIDLEASYRRSLATLPGTFTARLFGTYLIEKIVDDTVTRVDRAGEIGRNTLLNGPRFRGSLMLGYTLDRLRTAVQVNHVSAGNYDNEWGPEDILDNRIGSRTYVNLSARFDATDNLEVYGVINNLFDKGPAPNPNTGGGSSPFDGSLHDVLGRRYTLGIRYGF